MNNQTPLESAKQAFVEAGGKLNSASTQRKLTGAETRAKNEASRLAAPPNARAAVWIQTALGYLAVGFFLIILTGGVSALLIVIPAAEFAAVHEGLTVVTPDKPFITILTTSAVFIGILVLMFLGHVYADALTTSPRLTVRGSAARWLVWLGWSRAELWCDAPLNKVERDYLMIYAALNLSKSAVIITSLMGRLRDVLDRHGDKAFIHSVTSIINELSGKEILGIFASFLVLFGILKMLDVGVLFAFTAFKNSAGSLDLTEAKTTNFLEEYTRLTEIYQAQLLNDLTLEMTVQNNLKESPDS